MLPDFIVILVEYLCDQAPIVPFLILYTVDFVGNEIRSWFDATPGEFFGVFTIFLAMFLIFYILRWLFMILFGLHTYSNPTTTKVNNAGEDEGVIINQEGEAVMDATDASNSASQQSEEKTPVSPGPDSADNSPDPDTTSKFWAGEVEKAHVERDTLKSQVAGLESGYRFFIGALIKLTDAQVQAAEDDRDFEIGRLTYGMNSSQSDEDATDTSKASTWANKLKQAERKIIELRAVSDNQQVLLTQGVGPVRHREELAAAKEEIVDLNAELQTSRDDNERLYKAYCRRLTSLKEENQGYKDGERPLDDNMKMHLDDNLKMQLAAANYQIYQLKSELEALRQGSTNSDAELGSFECAEEPSDVKERNEEDKTREENSELRVQMAQMADVQEGLTEERNAACKRVESLERELAELKQSSESSFEDNEVTIQSTVQEQERLQGENAELRQQVKDLEAQMDTIQKAGHLQMCPGKLCAFKKTCEVLQSQIDQRAVEGDGRNQCPEKLRASQEECERLQKLLDQLTIERNAALERIRQGTQREHRQTSLDRRPTQPPSDYFELKTQVPALQAELQSIQDDYVEAMDQNAQLKRQIAALSQVSTSATQRQAEGSSDKPQNQTSPPNAETDRLLQERAQLLGIQQTTGPIEDKAYIYTASDLAAKTSELWERHDDLMDLLRRSKETECGLLSDNMKLGREMERVSAENMNLQREIDRLSSESTNSGPGTNHLSSENINLRREIDHLSNETMNLRREIDRLSTRTENGHADVDFESMTANLQQKADYHFRRAQQAEAANDHLNRSNNRLQGQMSDMFGQQKQERFSMQETERELQAEKETRLTVQGIAKTLREDLDRVEQAYLGLSVATAEKAGYTVFWDQCLMIMRREYRDLIDRYNRAVDVANERLEFSFHLYDIFCQLEQGIIFGEARQWRDKLLKDEWRMKLREDADYLLFNRDGNPAPMLHGLKDEFGAVIENMYRTATRNTPSFVWPPQSRPENAVRRDSDHRFTCARSDSGSSVRSRSVTSDYRGGEEWIVGHHRPEAARSLENQQRRAEHPATDNILNEQPQTAFRSDFDFQFGGPSSSHGFGFQASSGKQANFGGGAAASSSSSANKPFIFENASPFTQSLRPASVFTDSEKRADSTEMPSPLSLGQGGSGSRPDTFTTPVGNLDSDSDNVPSPPNSRAFPTSPFTFSQGAFQRQSGLPRNPFSDFDSNKASSPPIPKPVPTSRFTFGQGVGAQTEVPKFPLEKHEDSSTASTPSEDKPKPVCDIRAPAVNVPKAVMEDLRATPRASLNEVSTSADQPLQSAAPDSASTVDYWRNHDYLYDGSTDEETAAEAEGEDRDPLVDGSLNGEGPARPNVGDKDSLYDNSTDEEDAAGAQGVDRVSQVNGSVNEENATEADEDWKSEISGSQKETSDPSIKHSPPQQSSNSGGTQGFSLGNYQTFKPGPKAEKYVPAAASESDGEEWTSDISDEQEVSSEPSAETCAPGKPSQTKVTQGFSLGNHSTFKTSQTANDDAPADVAIVEDPLKTPTPGQGLSQTNSTSLPGLFQSTSTPGQGLFQAATPQPTGLFQYTPPQTPSQTQANPTPGTGLFQFSLSSTSPEQFEASEESDRQEPEDSVSKRVVTGKGASKGGDAGSGAGRGRRGGKKGGKKGGRK